MKGIIILSFILFILLSLVAGEDDLHNYKVIRARIEKKGDIIALNDWDLDVWSHDSNLIVGLNDILFFN